MKDTTIIAINKQEDIETLIQSLQTSNVRVGFQISGDVEREEHFRLMHEINERYKGMVANTNVKSARVA